MPQNALCVEIGPLEEFGSREVIGVSPIPAGLASLEEAVRTQTHRGTASCPHARERRLRGNQPHRPLDQGLRPPEPRDHECLWLRPPRLRRCVTKTAPRSAPPQQGLCETPRSGLWPARCPW